jgi:hypothetical protein
MSRASLSLLLLAGLLSASVQAQGLPDGGRKPALAAPPATLPRVDPTLQFNARPAWQERLDWIGRHGLPFARLRDNRDSQLVVGMHPDGYFGVFLTPRSR